MKAYRGAEVQHLSFLTSALDGGELSASHPSYSVPGVKVQYPFNRRLGGPKNWSGCFGDKSFLPLPEN